MTGKHEHSKLVVVEGAKQEEDFARKESALPIANCVGRLREALILRLWHGHRAGS